MSQKIKYTPEVCEHCGQSTTYIIAVDRGTVDIVKQIAKAIGRKGINIIHPRKEIEGITLTSNQVGNLSRPRFHGLIAAVRGNPGNYLLTRKGAAFLQGEPIPKFAVVSKDKHHQIGYFVPELYQVTVKDFTSDDEYWEGINYDVDEGRIVYNTEKQQPLFAK